MDWTLLLSPTQRCICHGGGGKWKRGAPSSATQEKEQMEWVEGGSEVRPSGAEKYVRLRREETQNVMHSLTGNTFGLHGWRWSPLLLCRFAHRARWAEGDEKFMLGRSVGPLGSRRPHLRPLVFWRNHRDIFKADETKGLFAKRIAKLLTFKRFPGVGFRELFILFPLPDRRCLRPQTILLLAAFCLQEAAAS